ncbi:Imidazolonepropionase [Chitinophaga jiangningensis]|uniref:Imidazolonepropionase n=1 Tax=Chitinophaga jiangningensis TaxID=1419482 RepID=A0A1M7MI66_9BACT|nr:amidohydrolase family protein [Chitinophaga jiangningensis]SHM90505.1 Imidazolonepropionase [Chitinophaga jiangningensis]
MIRKLLILCIPTLFLLSALPAPAAEDLLLKDANFIDGKSGTAIPHTDILIRNGKIVKTGKGLSAAGARVVNLSGKTVMPALICAHMHIGMLKGTTTSGENYTRENIIRQLQRYQDYGVLNVLSLGTDRPSLYENHLYDSLKSGLLPGARLFSAAYGFGVPGGAPPVEMGMNKTYRPMSDEKVASEMDSLVKLQPVAIKLWLDDFGGSFKKMDSSTYQAIIREAHKHGWKVAAHVYYLADARKLVRSGVDILAHSIRDSVIDDALVQEMKRRDVIYIPTLSLDEYAYSYAGTPAWLTDPFFLRAVEPGVVAMVSDAGYQNKIKNSPAYNRNRNAVENAAKNVKKLHDAGVVIAMGTDSGAQPIRVQGYSEHLELQLLVRVGLMPAEALRAATLGSAKVLGTTNQYGTLEAGKTADLVVLSANPLTDITNTHQIEAVYKAGTAVYTR